MQVIPIPSSKAAMVEKAFNLAAQKLEFKFVTKKCKQVLYFIAYVILKFSITLVPP
jgi:hypothetical protein